jgi:hypothetical protein
MAHFINAFLNQMALGDICSLPRVECKPDYWTVSRGVGAVCLVGASLILLFRLAEKAGASRSGHVHIWIPKSTRWQKDQENG